MLLTEWERKQFGKINNLRGLGFDLDLKTCNISKAKSSTKECCLMSHQIASKETKCILWSDYTFHKCINLIRELSVMESYLYEVPWNRLCTHVHFLSNSFRLSPAIDPLFVGGHTEMWGKTYSSSINKKFSLRWCIRHDWKRALPKEIENLDNRYHCWFFPYEYSWYCIQNSSLEISRAFIGFVSFLFCSSAYRFHLHRWYSSRNVKYIEDITYCHMLYLCFIK